jgi:hypothetical protein
VHTIAPCPDTYVLAKPTAEGGVVSGVLRNLVLVGGASVDGVHLEGDRNIPMTTNDAEAADVFATEKRDRPQHVLAAR